MKNVSGDTAENVTNFSKQAKINHLFYIDGCHWNIPYIYTVSKTQYT